jgi:hypothetical protein
MSSSLLRSEEGFQSPIPGRVRNSTDPEARQVENFTWREISVYSSLKIQCPECHNSKSTKTLWRLCPLSIADLSGFFLAVSPGYLNGNGLSASSPARRALLSGLLDCRQWRGEAPENCALFRSPTASVC